jgi:CcmD family protein
MPFLFAAFAVSWVVFFLYAWFLNRRQQEMAKEIRGLRQALDTQQAVDREER